MKIKTNINSGENGFSMIELMVVTVLILIITTVSLIYLTGTRKLYNTDQEALQVVDLVQEARQRALTQRETLRVEIDLTSNIGRIINENASGNVVDDKVIRQISLQPSSNVRIDMRPTNITSAPPEAIPAPIAVFAGSQHPLSAGHNVATFRFMPDGTVKDAGTNGLGANSVVTGATLYIWKPKTGSTTESDLAKAITIIGSTGSVRMWDWASAPAGYYWRDSRRSAYGNPVR
jgi:prepilin-type N-terminal cleavage/methylation domain-containing protein